MSGMLGNKRRALLESPLHQEKESNLSPITDEDLVINFGTKTAHIYRLLWKGVPSVRSLKKSNFERANRDEWVRSIYTALNTFDIKSMSGNTYFEELARYVRWLDTQSDIIVISDFFSEPILNAYNRHLITLCSRGEISRLTLSQKKINLRAILTALGKTDIAQRCLTRVANISTNTTEALGDNYIGIKKELIKAYGAYSAHYLAGTRPVICPLYDDYELTDKELRYAKRTMAQLLIENQLSTLALLIYISYTGSNLSPATELRRSEVRFKPEINAHYKLESIKRRAGHQKQTYEIGFTKLAMEFVTGWMSLSERINPAENARLFSFFGNDGEVYDRTQFAITPHKYISPILEKRGFPRFTARIFRASRSDVSLRSGNNIHETASASNHSIATLQRRYTKGNQNQNRLSISAGFNVMYDLSDARDKQEAIKEHTKFVGDIYSSDEWKALKEARTSFPTPAGVQCKDPFGSRAEKSLKPLQHLNSAKDAPCIDYLDCFECTFHALVVEVENIWMMLSFRDSILESISRPSINSQPSAKTDELLQKVEKNLKRLEDKDKAKFAEAVDKNNSHPHPAHAGMFQPTDFMR